VNSGELPVEKVVGHGAENGIEVSTKVLFLKVPELKPSQVGELKLVKVTLALIASLTPPILPVNNDQLVLSGATNNIPISPTAVWEYPLNVILTSLIAVTKFETVNVIG